MKKRRKLKNLSPTEQILESARRKMMRALKCVPLKDPQKPSHKTGKMSKSERAKLERVISKRRTQLLVADTTSSKTLSASEIDYKGTQTPIKVPSSRVVRSSAIYSSSLAERQQELYGD